MDVESQSQVSDIEKPSQISAPITDKPTVTTVLRVGQYILSTATLILVACAIDRNVLSPGVSSEEIVACASSAIALLVILYYFLSPSQNPNPSSKRITIILDSLVAALLLVTFIFGAFQSGQHNGACLGPDKIGVWDNTRGCKRMTAATVVAALDFVCFTASAAITAYL